MSLSLKKRKRTYYAEGRCGGERVHKSLKTRDVQVARALMRDLETRLLTGGCIVSKRWKDFADEFKAWISTQVKTGHDSTLARYEFVLNRFTKFLEAKTVLEVAHVDSAVLAEYAKDRLTDIHPTTGRAATPNAVRNDFRILHRCFGYAVQAKYLGTNPVVWQRPLTTNREKRPYSGTEIATMLEDHVIAAKPMLRAIILLFAYSGLRISDVIGLPLAALDLKAGTIVTLTRKRGTMVSLSIHPEVRGALELHFQCRTDAQRSSPYVFSRPDGQPLQRRALTSVLDRMFRRRAIAGAHVHRFRHTFAVRLLEQGASLYDVSKLLGINMQTAEQHYAPYCRELRERAARLIATLSPVSAANGKVVTFCAPLSPTSPRFGEQAANEDEPAVKAKP